VRMKVGDATATYAAGSSPRVEPPDSAVPAKA
jgi:hypothetical protein